MARTCTTQVRQVFGSKGAYQYRPRAADPEMRSLVGRVLDDVHGRPMFDVVGTSRTFRAALDKAKERLAGLRKPSGRARS